MSWPQDGDSLTLTDVWCEVRTWGLVLDDDGSDDLWAAMAPLLPPRKSHPPACHNPQLPDRNAMNAMLLVLRTGCRWHSLARWEQRADTYLAMLHLTLGLICWHTARSLKRTKSPFRQAGRYPPTGMGSQAITQSKRVI
ncbi:MAG: transposase, partial [Candidatus Sericytochromatia bacterium]|nr:transposase [Candidatus Sericytochromatia bacterium]